MTSPAPLATPPRSAGGGRVASAHARAAAIERRVVRAVFQPPVRMTVTEWADERRYLSPEANAMAVEAGGAVRYSSSVTPYHRGPMDALSDPLIEEVVLKFPSQDGKTEILLNFVGKRIDIDPGPILILQPTIEMAEAFSKDRLDSMARDTPVLRGKIKEGKSRGADNTIRHKKFPGGHATMVGANAPAGLAMRPIRDVAADEVDRYPKSAGREGDPLGLAFRRQATFRRGGKRLLISSPTRKGDSRIDDEYRDGTQERWLVPCPHCREMQFLQWGGRDTPFGIKWDTDVDGTHRPETAHYVCEHCAAVIDESWKGWMNAHGDWVAENPGHPTTRSFWKNALTSPWGSWVAFVREFLEVKRDPLRLQQFVNTVLSELWEDELSKLDDDMLATRQAAAAYPRRPGSESAEHPGPDDYLVPMRAGHLVRMVDTQDDRLETDVWAFGEGEEAWLVDVEVLPGDPSIPLGGLHSPWNDLAQRLRKPYPHEGGAVLLPQITFVDSGGHASKEVYAFTKAHQAMNCYAIKGASTGRGTPMLSRPSKNNALKAIMYLVGSFTAKEAVVKRFTMVKTPGPGFVHLAPWLDEEHRRQYTNERLVRKIVGPRVTETWIKYGACERFHLLAYALASLHRTPFLSRQLAQIAKQVQEKGARMKQAGATPSAAAPQTRPQLPPRRGSWVNWKG